jgi:hypothetical protein
MHLLNKQIYHYILFYVLIILAHDFRNQTPLKRKSEFEIYSLFKTLLDLTNVINIFVLHLVSMEYQLIYKPIRNIFQLIIRKHFLTELV